MVISWCRFGNWLVVICMLHPSLQVVWALTNGHPETDQLGTDQWSFWRWPVVIPEVTSGQLGADQRSSRKWPVVTWVKHPDLLQRWVPPPTPAETPAEIGLPRPIPAETPSRDSPQRVPPTPPVMSALLFSLLGFIILPIELNYILPKHMKLQRLSQLQNILNRFVKYNEHWPSVNSVLKSTNHNISYWVRS